LVEKTPAIIKSALPKDEADKLVAKLVELGCKVALK
jgi:ribosomal protein L7/L12